MDFHFNEIQDLLQQGARRFLTAEVDFEKAIGFENSKDGFSKKIWKEISKLGWTSVALPESIGGANLGIIELSILAEELGQAGVATPLIISSGLVGSCLKALADYEKNSNLLTELANGQIITAALIGAQGRDERSPPSTTIKTGKTGTVLIGKKQMVPFASAASKILVSAIDPQGQFTLVLVPTDDENIVMTRHRSLSGDPLFQVDFDRVNINDRQVLARGERAQSALEQGIDVATVLSMAESIGCCESIIALTAEHAKMREQFGQAIGSFQAVSHPIADMRIQTNACRLLMKEAAWLLDKEKPATFEISSAKVFANDAIPKIALDGHRLHGAIGYSNEYGLQLLTRRAKAFGVSWGDNQRQIARAAASLI